MERMFPFVLVHHSWYMVLGFTRTFSYKYIMSIDYVSATCYPLSSLQKLSCLCFGYLKSLPSKVKVLKKTVKQKFLLFFLRMLSICLKILLSTSLQKGLNFNASLQICYKSKHIASLGRWNVCAYMLPLDSTSWPSGHDLNYWRL